MRRRQKAVFQPSPHDLDAATAAMSAEDLREVIREMLLDLGDRAHRRAVTAPSAAPHAADLASCASRVR